MKHIDKLEQFEHALAARKPEAIAAVATPAKREKTAQALLKNKHVRENFVGDLATLTRYLAELASKLDEEPKKRRRRSTKAVKQQADRRASEILRDRPMGPAAAWPKGVLEALTGRGEPPAPHPWGIELQDPEAVRNAALWKLACAPGAPQAEILRLLQDPNARTIANMHVALEHRLAETLIANAANEPDVDGKLVANLVTWRAEERSFTLKDLAASVSVNHQNQLLGRLPNGERRYPNFHQEWEKYQAEKRDRAALRRRNDPGMRHNRKPI
jgi:hypothetical protein